MAQNMDNKTQVMSNVECREEKLALGYFAIAGFKPAARLLPTKQRQKTTTHRYSSFIMCYDETVCKVCNCNVRVWQLAP